VGEMALAFQGNRSSTSESMSAKIRTSCVLESPSSSGALNGTEQESTNFLCRGLNTKCFLLCESYHLKCGTKTVRDSMETKGFDQFDWWVLIISSL